MSLLRNVVFIEDRFGWAFVNAGTTEFIGPAFSSRKHGRHSDVAQRQREAYRQMSGEERLRIELGPYEARFAIAHEGIRDRFPDADDSFIEEKLR